MYGRCILFKIKFIILAAGEIIFEVLKPIDSSIIIYHYKPWLKTTPPTYKYLDVDLWVPGLE
jgi:hypothetical protein